MTEPLPISIHVDDDLKQQFIKLTSASNKLEAQFNFQTMTANWYSDEDNILFVQLRLETPQSFVAQQQAQQKAQQQAQQCEVTIFSDDVFSFYNKGSEAPLLICHIAITDAELTLLKQQEQLLIALIQVKLEKVLNLIAKQLNLPTI
ncbi:hypothetical protein A9Q74_14980 [Colwellia sp. 39_35_sub15_T18]|nr:hypothetical protein A9Q74_14980 [Colwellia sp. 39_35_sub15_T18]